MEILQIIAAAAQTGNDAIKCTGNPSTAKLCYRVHVMCKFMLLKKDYHFNTIIGYVIVVGRVSLINYFHSRFDNCQFSSVGFLRLTYKYQQY